MTIMLVQLLPVPSSDLLRNANAIILATFAFHRGIYVFYVILYLHLPVCKSRKCSLR